MNGTIKQFLTIVLGATLLACLLGICLDLVTANIAVEYFSVHHPRILETENPWILALFWGIAASWWFGAGSGLIVASINSRRQQPLMPLRILSWMTIACVVLWTTMIAILLTVLSASNSVPAQERTETFESDRRLVAVAMAHQFEYLIGAIALAVVCFMTWKAKPECES